MFAWFNLVSNFNKENFMKLFLLPGACSLASHIALEETGLSYETASIDRQTKLLPDGSDFMTVNPKGYVPALQLDDGVVLTEGAAILQYVADQAPAKSLAPTAGTVARYQLQGWLNFIGSEVHKSFSPLFSPATSDDWKATARANLERRLGYLNDHLAAQPFLMGETFTVADAYLFVVLSWAGFVKLNLSSWQALVSFQQRVAARPAVQAALKAEGLAR
jgi:glutathione S-transferase